jgi:hypothetical protein
MSLNVIFDNNQEVATKKTKVANTAVFTVGETCIATQPNAKVSPIVRRMSPDAISANTTPSCNLSRAIRTIAV